MMTCDVCRQPMTASVRDWTFVCDRCGLWQSSMQPAIDVAGHSLSEADRFRGLEHIRSTNFDRIFALLAQLHGDSALRLLDVGCAYGWFLEAARGRGITAIGIEPDPRTAQVARGRGLDILEGYFPQCLPTSARFEVIVFNDTLEHIPDVQAMLAACAAALTSGGTLVLSVPTSSGTLFRLAAGLARLGWTGPWRRLWQESFPSPHVYYFNRENLDAALRSHGFSRFAAEGTVVFHPRGLWSRLQFDRRSSTALNAWLYAGLLAAYPVYRMVARADTELLIYRRDGSGGGSPGVGARQ
jgi:SAM-dependent methyltransferase